MLLQFLNPYSQFLVTDQYNTICGLVLIMEHSLNGTDFEYFNCNLFFPLLTELLSGIKYNLSLPCFFILTLLLFELLHVIDICLDLFIYFSISLSFFKSQTSLLCIYSSF